jgi:hypothetical protein
LRASVTFWEASAPDKLPTSHGPHVFFAREDAIQHRVVFHCCLPAPRKERINGSHLCYAALDHIQWQAVVKLHGVFLSCYGFTAS